MKWTHKSGQKPDTRHNFARTVALVASTTGMRTVAFYPISCPSKLSMDTAC